MVLKVTLVFASSKRIIEARLKYSVKITIKFIRKGLNVKQTESRLSPE
jgi:hypothetical protein